VEDIKFMNDLILKRTGYKGTLLFRRDGVNIKYCYVDEDGNKGTKHHLFTGLFKPSERDEMHRMIKSNLTYYKTAKLADKVIAWYESCPLCVKAQ